MPSISTDLEKHSPSDQPSPEHLFSLPEYDFAQGKFIYVAIDEVRDRMFPLIGKIPKVKVDHLQHTRVTAR
jgi:hypothetical protein